MNVLVKLLIKNIKIFLKNFKLQNTLKKYSKYIKNTLEYSYSNGVMERNNNTCKLIKRISFGFRNFRNMKSRIMIITNIFRKEKREYHTKYSIPKYA